MTSKEKTISDIHDMLMEAPFPGTTTQLGVAIARRTGRFYTGAEIRTAFAKTRTREFQDENRWSVKYVGRGTPFGEYRILSHDHANTKPTLDDLRARVQDLLVDNDRWNAQLEMVLAGLDGRTAEGRLAKTIRRFSDATLSGMEELVVLLDGNGR